MEALEVSRCLCRVSFFLQLTICYPICILGVLKLTLLQASEYNEDGEPMFPTGPKGRLETVWEKDVREARNKKMVFYRTLDSSLNWIIPCNIQVYVGPCLLGESLV